MYCLIHCDMKNYTFRYNMKRIWMLVFYLEMLILHVLIEEVHSLGALSTLPQPQLLSPHSLSPHSFRLSSSLLQAPGDGGFSPSLTSAVKLS